MPIVYRPYVEKLGGNTSATAFVGNEGELFYDPASTSLRISDGVTPGGTVLGSSFNSSKASFDPVFTDANVTFAGATVTADYVRHDEIVHYHVNVSFAGTTDYGNSQYQITLPFPSKHTMSTTTGTLHQIGAAGGSGANTYYHISGHLDLDYSNTTLKLFYSGSTSDLAWKFNTPGGVPAANVNAHWAVAGDAHFDLSGSYHIDV